MLTLNSAHISPVRAVVQDFLSSTFFAVSKLVRLLYTMIIVVLTIIILLANIVAIVVWINLWRWMTFTHLRTVYTLRALLDDPEFGSTEMDHMVVPTHAATQTENDVEEDIRDTDEGEETDGSYETDETWWDSYELNEEVRKENGKTAASDTDPVVLEVIEQLAGSNTTSVPLRSSSTSLPIIRERYTTPKTRRSEAITQAPMRWSEMKKHHDESVAERKRSVESLWRLNERKKRHEEFVAGMKHTTESAWSLSERKDRHREFVAGIKRSSESASRTLDQPSDPASASRVVSSCQNAGHNHFDPPNKNVQEREMDTATTSVKAMATAPTDNGAQPMLPVVMSKMENATSIVSQGSVTSGTGPRSSSVASSSSRSSSKMARLADRPKQSARMGPIDLLSDSYQDQLEMLMPVLKARPTD